MPHFADPAEDRLPSEVDLPRESPRVAADDAANVFLNQVVARPKPPVEPPATRDAAHNTLK